MQEEDEGPQRESRAAILKAKFGGFLATLYAETLGSMRRLNQAQGLEHFNAGMFLFLRSLFVAHDLHVCRANHTGPQARTWTLSSKCWPAASKCAKKSSKACRERDVCCLLELSLVTCLSRLSQQLLSAVALSFCRFWVAPRFASASSFAPWFLLARGSAAL